MSLASEPRSAYWSEHFNELAKFDAVNEQLDFSNQAQVVQNYAFVLEACGTIADKRVLDAGFGNGDLSRMLDRLGGQVTAFDVVANRIARLREEAPSIAWWHDDISTWKQPRNAEPFDLVVACETLQYVEFNSAVRRFLDVVAENGRLIILIPNADCPIVRRVSERFEHKYVGVSMASLGGRLSGITSECQIAYRGIYFQEDQTLVPYRTGPWIRIKPGHRLPEPHFSLKADGVDTPSQSTPNRLQVVVSRTAPKASASE